MSEGKGRSGLSEVEIEAGTMGRLQAGISGGGRGSIGETKSAIFRTHGTG
jgi:hypothetical protein